LSRKPCRACRLPRSNEFPQNKVFGVFHVEHFDQPRDLTWNRAEGLIFHELQITFHESPPVMRKKGDTRGSQLLTVNF
jgi:hypothetical protein